MPLPLVQIHNLWKREKNLNYTALCACQPEEGANINPMAVNEQISVDNKKMFTHLKETSYGFL